ncbi:MAG: NUDIX domain-containing protein [Nitrososphaerota archaeon]|nr:NUDIX domain-containing protein [Nitrososphaerota archaeon]
MIEEVSAGAVIYHYESKSGLRRYLVLHYPAGHWDFPKGAVENGETEQQAAIREIFEESSLRISEFVPNFRKEIEYHYRRQEGLVHKRVIFFLAESSAISVKISFEHSGYDWLFYDQALRRLTFENAKSVLREADSWLSKESD